MNIIFPLNGTGERFKKEGYQTPKPLIRVKGREIFFRVLKILDYADPKDKVIIPYHHSLKRFNFEDRVNIFIRENTNFSGSVEFFRCPVPVYNNPVETLEYILDKIEDDKKIISIDGDTVYDYDIFSLLKKYNNVVTTSTNYQGDKIYSFVNVLDDKVLKIIEKEKISDLICTGIYQFEDLKTLKKAISTLHFSARKKYISELVQSCIENNDSVFHLNVDKFVCLGTPIQISINYENIPFIQSRFCFDFDGILIDEKVNPIQENISLLQKLYQEGHYIIIYTARGMKSNNSNIGKMAPKIKWVIDILDQLKIPYHEIYFNKPWADYYIDDHAFNPFYFSSPLKELGYLNNPAIQPRTFNRVKSSLITTIQKVGSANEQDKINAEIFWYQNMDENIKKYFPIFIRKIVNGYEIEKIKGIELSKALLNRTLTEESIDKILEILNEIHNSRVSTNDVSEYDISYNYLSKYLSRLEEFKLVNKDLYLAKIDKFEKVKTDLEKYLCSGLIKEVVIHGDPVFTNILSDENKNLYFIDMRGLQNKVITMKGDINYDYAKVYQSLMGYDLVLMGYSITEYNEYLSNLREYFLSRIDEKLKSWIPKISSSLILSLLPLHDESLHSNFIDLIQINF